MKRLADIVQRSDTPAGRVFDFCVLGLILYSIATFSIETLPALSDGAKAVLNISEVAVTLLFTLEYVLRLATAPGKLRYVFSFYGIVDLLAIVPFYLSLGSLDLRVVRVVRVFRILKVLRYSQAMARFGRALTMAKEEILLYLLASGILLYLSAVGIYYFEHDAQPEHFQSILHSLWWAVTTLTTVGYGDFYPITPGGKLFTFLVLVCGLGVVAVPSGLVAAALSKVRQEEDATESP